MKTDITVSKGMTLNMGNYQSVKPEYSLTIKDVSLEDVEEVSKNMTNIVNSVLYLQTIMSAVDMQGISSLYSFNEEFENEQDVLVENIIDSINTLKKLGEK